MSGDPLDAVGQGHAWYGYKLPGLDDPAQQPSSEGNTSLLSRPRRPGLLMADQLFSSVGSKQTADSQLSDEAPGPAAGVTQQHLEQQQQLLRSQQLQLQYQQLQQQQHLHSAMQQSARGSTLLAPYTGTTHPPGSLEYPFPSLSLAGPAQQFPQMYMSDSTALMLQQVPASQLLSDGVTPGNESGYPIAQYDQLTAQQLAHPLQAAAPGDAGAALALSAEASSLFTRQQQQQQQQQQAAAMMATAAAAAAAAGGNHASVYDAVSGSNGLGLWGWGFPTPLAPDGGAGAAAASGMTGIPDTTDVTGNGAVGDVLRAQFQPNDEAVALSTPIAPHGGISQAPGAVMRHMGPGWPSELWGGPAEIGSNSSIGGGVESGSAAAMGERAREGEAGREKSETGVGAGAGAGAEKARKPVLSASELKRQERNAREQRRSLMTSQQIDKLRQLLLESGIRTKANKCSILSEVSTYATELEEKLERLELDRQKWLAETAHAPEVARQDPNGGSIDCKQVFAHASVALGMATVEGLFMESNLQFQALSGYRDDQLKQLTLLSLTAAAERQETFEQLSAMLTDGTGKAPKHALAKAILKDNNDDLSLSITLARDALGRPKFFLCSLLPNASIAPTTSASSFGKGDPLPVPLQPPAPLPPLPEQAQSQPGSPGTRSVSSTAITLDTADLAESSGCGGDSGAAEIAGQNVDSAGSGDGSTGGDDGNNGFANPSSSSSERISSSVSELPVSSSDGSLDHGL